jgi:parallel beta-helix repeat protein
MKTGIIILAVLAIPTLAFSAIIVVPDDYPYIQQAIYQAVDGDTVLVKPGTYVENIDFSKKTITVKSTDGAESTIIDGGNSPDPDFGSVVRIRKGEGPDAVLEGFTLTNGTGTYHTFEPGYHNFVGGGIYCIGSHPTIRNNIIKENMVSENYEKGGGIFIGSWSSPAIIDNLIEGNYGGGIHSYDSTPFISGNIITGNQPGYGIYCDHSSAIIMDNSIIAHSDRGIYCKGSSDTIARNTIIRNEGGGIYCSGKSVEIRNNIIEENTTLGEGGGIYCFYSPKIMDNIINANSASKGGGIYCRKGASPFIRNNDINANNAISEGGGISCEESFPDIIDNTISENTAERGAGIYMNLASPRIVDNLICSNTASLEGGGICCNESSPVTTGNLISGNRSDSSGGGIYFFKSSATLENNMIGNNSADCCGGGIYCMWTTLTIKNNTIMENSADTDGGGGICCYSLCLADVMNTILWNNSAPKGPEICLLNPPIPSPSTVDIGFSDLKGGQSGVHLDLLCVIRWGYGMIDEDPLFVDPAKVDYHLTHPSPCRDTGSNAVVTEPFDIEGDPRIAWGGTVDMGADEFYTHLYCTGDFTPSGSVEGKLIGLPGTSPVALCLGAGILEPPLSTAWGNFHLQAPWLMFPLVPIPGDGVLVLPAIIPATPPAPYDLPMQALIGLDPDSLTNLFVLEVR